MSDFETDFADAIQEIASRFIDSCEFEVPRGEDPEAFDPALVNVGVTFAGEERIVLPRSSEATGDSWNYSTRGDETLIIQGPICERLRSAIADVEIVNGCPSILI